MAAHFDEMSGVVVCQTNFGRWWQTMGDVNIEIACDNSKFEENEKKHERITRRDVSCTIKSQYIDVKLFGTTLIKGDLYGSVVSDDTLWTIEDEGKVMKIVLTKTKRSAENCWKSLLKDGSFSPDVWTLDQMQQKLTLQRYQAETPGFDFSSATITGNYGNGGPNF